MRKILLDLKVKYDYNKLVADVMGKGGNVNA